MQRMYMLGLAGAMLAGCASTHNPSHTTEYDLSTIDSGGIYELRSYLSKNPCPAEPAAASESTGLVIALAAPLVEKGVEVAVDATMKKIAAYGNDLAQPITVKSEIYPGKDKLADLSRTGCIFMIYGRYGGEGSSNIDSNTMALKLYTGSAPSKHLTSNVGFAMQIGIDITGDKLSLTPLHLFYPKAFHTGSSVDKHSLAIEVTVGAEKAVINFEEVEAGSYYGYKSLAAHKRTLSKSAMDAGTIDLAIVEGPDNKILGEALADFAGDEETKNKLITELQGAIKKRLEEESKPAVAE